MQPRPLSRSLRTIVSLVLIAAWFVAANHCLFAAVPPAHTASGHCPGHTAPEKKTPGGCADQNCCKSLSAPASVLAKNLVGGKYLGFEAADFPALFPMLETQPRTEVVAELDTGPPRGNWFTQSVLQHSLLAHAPPIFG